MINLAVASLQDLNFMIALLVAISVTATIIAIAMPFFFGDSLEGRMKDVAIERERMRQRERERLSGGSEKIDVRRSAKGYVRATVNTFDLNKWIGQEEMRMQLVRAGWRGQGPYVTFLFFRMITPIALFFGSLVYIFGVLQTDQPTVVKLGGVVFATYIGMQLPGIYVKNHIQNRQESIRRAFPDTLDLLLICVEAGMSIEVALKRVASEVGSQSVALAEELMVTTAELAYLQDRRMAFENLANRTDLDGVKAVCTALIQAERYGTPIAQTLRVMAQENRDMRMAEAEKRAASLPPKLTVPMILFFLPVLFVIILAPGVMRTNLPF